MNAHKHPARSKYSYLPYLWVSLLINYCFLLTQAGQRKGTVACTQETPLDKHEVLKCIGAKNFPSHLLVINSLPDTSRTVKPGRRWWCSPDLQSKQDYPRIKLTFINLHTVDVRQACSILYIHTRCMSVLTHSTCSPAINFTDSHMSEGKSVF